MADEDTEVKEDPPKVDPLPPVQHLTHEHLEALERKIRDEITELHAGDKKEREELKAQLEELKEYKAKQEQAEQDREKSKDSESTMVLPPTDIPPQQPNPPPSAPAVVGEDAPKKGRWKSVW